MAQDFGALTNMWMLDPYMFDPTQKSNKFSNFNDAALPWPPTYNTGNVGAPTNAMGQPIQSYVDWNTNAQAQYQRDLAAYNAQPGPAASTPGTTLNSTPQPPSTWPGQAQGAAQPGSLAATPAMQELAGNYAKAQAALTPQQLYAQQQTAAMRNQSLQEMSFLTDAANQGGGFGRMPGGAFNPGSGYYPLMSTLGQQQPGAAAAPGKGPPPTPPNNWMAALNALANPGNPVTPGASVPMATGYQPAGGVNAAFLNQAGAGGRNQDFLSALRAIQGR